MFPVKALIIYIRVTATDHCQVVITVFHGRNAHRHSTTWRKFSTVRVCAADTKRRRAPASADARRNATEALQRRHTADCQW